jgi:hypothetical protein
VFIAVNIGRDAEIVSPLVALPRFAARARWL